MRHSTIRWLEKHGRWTRFISENALLRPGFNWRFYSARRLTGGDDWSLVFMLKAFGWIIRIHFTGMPFFEARLEFCVPPWEVHPEFHFPMPKRTIQRSFPTPQPGYPWWRKPKEIRWMRCRFRV